MVSIERGKKNDQDGEWGKEITFYEHEFHKVNIK